MPATRHGDATIGTSCLIEHVLEEELRKSGLINDFLTLRAVFPI
jgi:hypothetical protein